MLLKPIKNYNTLRKSVNNLNAFVSQNQLHQAAPLTVIQTSQNVILKES